MRDPALKAIAATVRAERLADDSTAAILRELLTATKRDGTPDHAIRARGLELRLRFKVQPQLAPRAAIPDGAMWVVPDAGG